MPTASAAFPAGHMKMDMVPRVTQSAGKSSFSVSLTEPLFRPALMRDGIIFRRTSRSPSIWSWCIGRTASAPGSRSPLVWPPWPSPPTRLKNESATWEDLWHATLSHFILVNKNGTWKAAFNKLRREAWQLHLLSSLERLSHSPWLHFTSTYCTTLSSSIICLLTMPFLSPSMAVLTSSSFSCAYWKMELISYWAVPKYQGWVIFNTAEYVPCSKNLQGTYNILLYYFILYSKTRILLTI